MNTIVITLVAIVIASNIGAIGLMVNKEVKLLGGTMTQMNGK